MVDHTSEKLRSELKALSLDFENQKRALLIADELAASLQLAVSAHKEEMTTLRSSLEIADMDLTHAQTTRLEAEEEVSRLRLTLETSSKPSQVKVVSSMTVDKISMMLMLPSLQKLQLPEADSLIFESMGLSETDEDVMRVDTHDQAKKMLSSYPDFPSITIGSSKGFESEHSHMVEFVSRVDDFAARQCGTLTSYTIGRFAAEVLHKLNPSFMMELGDGTVRPLQSWIILRGLILAYHWTPTLVIYALHRFQTFTHQNGTSFKDFVRELVRRYLFFRSLLPTDEMFPHMTGHSMILMALAKLHSSMYHIYHKHCGEFEDDIIRVFTVLVNSIFIPKSENNPPKVPNPTRPTPTSDKDKTPKDGKPDPKKVVPTGWVKIPSADRYTSLRGRCMSCGGSGHKSKECTAVRDCDHASVCSKLTTWKHNTCCCEYAPPPGWVKPT
jgi:hypothetical protein